MPTDATSVRRTLNEQVDAIVAEYNKTRADFLRINSGAVFHADARSLVTTADASSEATAVALANALKAAHNADLASEVDATTGVGHHLAADTTNVVTTADATDEASAITLANELYTDHNAHVIDLSAHAGTEAAATATNQEATATNQEATATNQEATATNAAMKVAGSHVSRLPAAADLISIVAVYDSADGAAVIAAQPDVPRKVQLDIIEGGAPITAGTGTLVGEAWDGTVQQQVFDLTGGTKTVVSDDAYASITSFTVAGLVGGGVATTLSIGGDVALALPVPAGAANLVVFGAYVDGVAEAVGVVDATARTIAPTTPADASKVFDFNYRYEVTPTQNAHTHVQDAHNHTQDAHNHTQDAHNHASTSAHLASSATASDATTLYTRLNDLKAKRNVHVAAALNCAALEVVDP